MSKLICDSNCELWFTQAEEWGLDFIRMPYTYGGEVYAYDFGKNTDFKKFYTAVRGGEIPKTMALNPEEYKEILAPSFEKGEDVLYVSFSHKMSGTFSSLDAAVKELKETYPERKCNVFDTKAISVGSALQVEHAVRLKKAGKSDEEILADLEGFRDKTVVYFMVDDLMHLKRGGRLSAGAAVAGTMLGLKPVLTFDEEGGLAVVEKVMGRKKGLTKLAEKVAQGLKDLTYPVYVLDADCPADGDALAETIRAAFPSAEVRRQPVGPVIGSHCGPGTVAVGFVSDRRPIPLA